MTKLRKLGCIDGGLIKTLVVVATLVPGAASSCAFDTDCNPGSKCAKASGQIYGVCVGGISPGNKFDRQPVYSPLDPNRTTGNTCSFDTDCGPGSKCVKSGGSIYGACLRQQSGAPQVIKRQQQENQPFQRGSSGNVVAPAPKTPPRPGEGYIEHIMREQTQRQPTQQRQPRFEGCNPRVQSC